MKKADIAMMVHTKMECTKAAADAMVNEIFDAMAQEMKKGGDVDIAGFGKFSGTMRKAREARNPQTGATLKVPAQRVPKFKASKTLKDTVKG